MFRPKCNHIVGTELHKFKMPHDITHEEHMKRKDKWDGVINWKCPICNKSIWIWKTIRDSRLGRITVRKYIGGRV